jgi:hypothetical protein
MEIPPKIGLGWTRRLDDLRSPRPKRADPSHRRFLDVAFSCEAGQDMVWGPLSQQNGVPLDAVKAESLVSERTAGDGIQPRNRAATSSSRKALSSKRRGRLGESLALLGLADSKRGAMDRVIHTHSHKTRRHCCFAKYLILWVRYGWLGR